MSQFLPSLRAFCSMASVTGVNVGPEVTFLVFVSTCSFCASSDAGRITGETVSSTAPATARHVRITPPIVWPRSSNKTYDCYDRVVPESEHPKVGRKCAATLGKRKGDSSLIVLLCTVTDRVAERQTPASERASSAP